jgi:p-aminobenzoyl-glutamate transporter AbgT
MHGQMLNNREVPSDLNSKADVACTLLKYSCFFQSVIFMMGIIIPYIEFCVMRGVYGVAAVTLSGHGRIRSTFIEQVASLSRFLIVGLCHR